MKHLLHPIFLLLLFCSNSYSQKPDGVIGFPELNLLYRNYTNKIEVAVSNTKGKEVVLIGSPNIIIEKDSSRLKYSNSYFVYVKNEFSGREASINITLVNNKRKDTVLLKAYKFRVQNLPTPNLFLGSSADNERCLANENRLFAKYDASIPLNCYFSVVSWEFIIDNDTLKGSGNSLKSVEDVRKKVTTEKRVEIIANIVGPFGYVNKIRSYFILLPWDEELYKKQNTLIECGG